MKMVYNIMKYPKTNGLCIRRYEVLHRESTFAQLKWATKRLGVEDKWKSSLSPLSLTYIPTGQKIIFRGLDNAESITSITVEEGSITFVWIEEAYQIEKEADFDKLDLSIRGIAPEGAYKQFILTFNPWDQSHWMKKRFFDDPDKNTLAMTTNYLCNEWLGDDDLEIFESLKGTTRYRVEGLGDWGITRGRIFENWEIKDFNTQELLNMSDGNGFARYKMKFGMDFGFGPDPTAFIALLVDQRAFEIYVIDEWYAHGATNQEIFDQLSTMGYARAKIIADCAEPRTINELMLLGLNRIWGSKKGADSVRAGIQKLQDYKIYVHPKCKNLEIELSNHCWAEDRSGKLLARPADDGYHHLIDAMRYATEDCGSRNFEF